MKRYRVLRDGVELRKIDAPSEATALAWAQKRWGDDVTVAWDSDVDVEAPA